MKKKITIAVVVAAMLLAIFAPMTAQAADDTGWKKIDGYWYFYYEVDYYARGGVHWINDTPYYFDDNGKMQTGWIKEVNENEWGSWTNWFYADSSGALATGWKKVGNTWYYFEPDYPYMYYGGIREINGKDYYFSNSGAMLTGWIKDYQAFEDGYSYTHWYYANSSGVLLSGWQKISGSWYYFKPKDSEDYWYIDTYQMFSDGYYEINGTPYYFYPSGAMGIGWIKRTYTYTYEGYTSVNWYYANSSGVLQTGWQKLGGEWYYFDPYDYYMQVGYRFIDEKVYIFQTNGAWATKAGWLRVDFPDGYYDWYYLKAGGDPYKGWQKIGGKWYYFNPNIGWMAYKQTMRIDGKLYLFEESGALASTAGWKKFTYKGEGGQTRTYWYYTNADGTAKTGWFKDGGTWYYFDENYGQMMSSNMIINGKINLFKANGAWDDYAKTGWVKGDSSYYYATWYYSMDDEGTPASGWQEIDGVTYYFDPYSYRMYNQGVYWVDGDPYFFKENGEVGKGLIVNTINYGSIDNPYSYTEILFANDDGIVQTGWQTIDGDEYYFSPQNYRAYVGTAEYIEADETHVAGTYIFDQNGVCVGRPESSEAMS